MLVQLAYGAAFAISLAVIAAVALRSMWLAALLGAIEGSVLCLVGLAASLRRSTKTDPVVQVRAADSASVTESAVVIQVTAAIAAASAVSANMVRSIAPGAGGGSAILGGRVLSSHGAGRGGGSATLSFHSDVMDRLATGNYPRSTCTASASYS